LDQYVKTSTIKALGYNEILALEKTQPIKYNRLRMRLAKSMEPLGSIAKIFGVNAEALSQIIKDKGWKKSNRKFGRGTTNYIN